MSFTEEGPDDRVGYRFCCLENGDLRQLVWLPAKLAIPGHMVKLRTAESWENGWIVRMACTLVRTEAELDVTNRMGIVRSWKHDARRQRQAVAKLERER